ncbi:CLUMA_CG018658, isoform A [Clunio marinus]|uniref:CLUMA_CG018658, isoform A n=1 Tax=Clunio marinus TaxID=568069 RepID=A0A1J1IZJ9_9DIPT|nr:CLUMA_CG018658, isoform A [Clunio marinus]
MTDLCEISPFCAARVEDPKVDIFREEISSQMLRLEPFKLCEDEIAVDGFSRYVLGKFLT